MRSHTARCCLFPGAPLMLFELACLPPPARGRPSHEPGLLPIQPGPPFEKPVIVRSSGERMFLGSRSSGEEFIRLSDRHTDGGRCLRGRYRMQLHRRPDRDHFS
ncbi:hypothetical protein DPEC_G00073610 [Dallia pectoralis]|uniref:Uncharacterized protein n=1 Tax=Dallia pectoralis TaxID=75939 RepID=A0ACC2H3M9_DALPE|nr:hypothetical protein DPEC_G00073610 [Dallia pectoralis]